MVCMFFLQKGINVVVVVVVVVVDSSANITLAGLWCNTTHHNTSGHFIKTQTELLL